MGTKNIARTAIEGGRYWGNAFDRGWSHREERQGAREWLERVKVDGEEALASAPAERRPVRKQFRDKLAVPERWLASHVGRPWDEIYARIRREFDTRTTAGRHIVFDHLLTWVVRECDDHEHRWGGSRFLVDADGILREGARRKRTRRWALAPGKVRHSVATLRAWATERKVGAGGQVLFWFTSVDEKPLVCTDPQCKAQHVTQYYPWTRDHEHVRRWFRQQHRLTDDEVRFWHTIEADLQAELWYPRR
jgi:hypothetical protein